MNNDRSRRARSATLSRLLAIGQNKRDGVELADRKRRERRRAALIAALIKYPKMTRTEDRKIVASNLGKILDRFEREGKGKKKDVLRLANMGDQSPDSTDSTKLLYNYTLPEGTTASDQRIAKLVKRTENYKKLAQIAANIAGWTEENILTSLFDGSSYDSGEASGPVDLPDYLFDLNDTYETLRKFPCCDESGNFVVNCQVSPLPEAAGRFPGFFGKAIPGITLYRVLASELPVDFASEEGMDLTAWPDDCPPDSLIEQLTFRRYFEVRLGVAPEDASGKITLFSTNVVWTNCGKSTKSTTLKPIAKLLWIGGRMPRKASTRNHTRGLRTWNGRLAIATVRLIPRQRSSRNGMTLTMR
jgi:hypothetical protein